ncbi:MAG: M48 family metalloprotease [Nitrospinae bacterium]|nr:M48 family metalloprotease [Nitrospinota bacterium]
MKKFLAFLALAVVSLIWTQSSHSFKLDDFLESMAKPPPPQSQPAKKQAPQQEAPKQQPAQKGGGGLIGLGESLGIFDKKTSRILQKSVGALQAFQPIGLEEEKAIGGSLALEVFHRFGGMYKNAALQNYVNLVGQSVAEVSDRPEIDYHFAVLNTDNPNAFATPGGYVFVSVGLLRMLQNEAQLAGVLGHEIAHITRKHALKTLQRSKVLSGLSGLTLAAMDADEGLFDQVINEVADVLFTRGLDRDLEFEADKLGMEYAYRMGYHPAGLKDFIKILGQASSRGSSIFLSTHPGPGARFQALGRLLPRYKAVGLFPILARRYQSTVKGQL